MNNGSTQLGPCALGIAKTQDDKLGGSKSRGVGCRSSGASLLSIKSLSHKLSSLVDLKNAKDVNCSKSSKPPYKGLLRYAFRPPDASVSITIFIGRSMRIRPVDIKEVVNMVIKTQSDPYMPTNS